MNSTQKIPVYVISLARHEARRRFMKEQLDRQNISYEFIDAVDGENLNPTNVANITSDAGIQLTLTSIGCALSHFLAYERICNNRDKVALILEDDAVLNPKIADLLESGCASLDFDYCFLDCDDHNLKGPVFYDADSVIHLNNVFKAYTLSDGPQAAHAYLITLRAAETRLAFKYPIKQASDCYDLLPYSIHFRAIISPKAAWISIYSMQSSTSSHNVENRDIPLFFLRKYSSFGPTRDLVTLRSLKKFLIMKNLIRAGALPPGKRWRPLPTGRELLIVA